MFKSGFKNISAAAIINSRLLRVDNSPKAPGVDTIPTAKPVKIYTVETFPRIYARLQTLSLLSIIPAVSPPPGIIQHERIIIIIIIGIVIFIVISELSLKYINIKIDYESSQEVRVPSQQPLHNEGCVCS